MVFLEYVVIFSILATIKSTVDYSGETKQSFCKWTQHLVMS